MHGAAGLSEDAPHNIPGDGFVGWTTLDAEALMAKTLRLQVGRCHNRQRKMLHTAAHVPVFRMGELS